MRRDNSILVDFILKVKSIYDHFSNNMSHLFGYTIHGYILYYVKNDITQRRDSFTVVLLY